MKNQIKKLVRVIKTRGTSQRELTPAEKKVLAKQVSTALESERALHVKLF